MLELATLIAHHARYRPGHTAVVFEGERLSYRQFAARVARVGNMLRGLGKEEVDSVIEEQGRVDVGCDFCGVRYQFDSVDVSELFAQGPDHPPSSSNLQ